jgi:hypothetical protein
MVSLGEVRESAQKHSMVLRGGYPVAHGKVNEFGE